MNEAILLALINKGLIKELYQDLAQPGVREVGTAIGRLFGMGNTLTCFYHDKLKIRLQNQLEVYREKMAKIEPQDVVPVAPEIGVPIIERLAYAEDDVIRELYASLLASASNRNWVNHAHPRFVHLIESLSPDEALLIEKLRMRQDSYYLIKTAIDGGSIHVGCHDEKDFSVSVSFPEHADAYVSNLLSMGILARHEVDEEIDIERGTVTFRMYQRYYFPGGSQPLPCIQGPMPVYAYSEIGRLFMKALKPEEG